MFYHDIQETLWPVMMFVIDLSKNCSMKIIQSPSRFVNTNTAAL